MSKNNKEKSSFWKKLGLGKNKPSTSSTISEHVASDRYSLKSKRQSDMSLYSPTIQPSNEYPTPPLPSKIIKKQPRVELPKVVNNDVIPSNSQLHVETTVDISTTGSEFIATPTAETLHQESNKEKSPEQIHDTKPLPTTEQPSIITPVTHKQEAVINSSNSSFVVLAPKSTNELEDIISELKLELENEKATVNALQKQKQAVGKDLDYLELTVDELYTEKTDLLQQLEDEKIKSQHYLNDLNLLLEKQKSTADSARDQYFAMDQTKLEYETIQEQLREEKETLASELTYKDKMIRELKAKLNATQEQVETLESKMEQMAKSHADEISRLVAQAAAEKERKVNTLPLHTPNGSPRMKSKEDDTTWNYPASPIIPVPSSSTPFKNYEQYSTPPPANEIPSPEDYFNDLDDQLTKLLKEKEKLQSMYSKIPLSGGGPQSRKHKEDLEGMLDQVDSQLSKVRQKIRRC